MCTPTPFCQRGAKFWKRDGGLTGVGGKEGGDLFKGGCNFYIKDKLNSEIFNDKKSLKKQKCFSLS